MNGTTIFFDTETGGVEPKHPTIQIACIAVDPQWAELETVEMKLEFDEAACDPAALKMNSYEPQRWEEEAILPEHARDTLEPFFRKHGDWQLTSARGKSYRTARIAGHNAATFDAPRLKALWGGGYAPFAWFYCLDTVQLALWWFATKGEKQPRNYQLGTLCEHFGIEHADAHDALGDVRATIALAKRLS